MEERARRIVVAAIELAEKGGFEGVRLRGGAGGGPPTELERRVSQALVHVWFASLTGWASGLHGVEAIVADTCSAADLILRGSARGASDGNPGLPPHREHV